MICPTGARIRCGPTWATWESGKCLFFDDSYEHEVEHFGETLRVVLLIRFWHPELNDPTQWQPVLMEGLRQQEEMARRRLVPPMTQEMGQILGPVIQGMMLTAGV